MSDDLAGRKAAARRRALAVRLEAHGAGSGLARRAAGHALEAIAPLRGALTVAAYIPVGSELDTTPAMLALHGLGFRVCAPVVEAKGAPLRFRAWRPGAALVEGPFGVRVPAEGAEVVPDVILAPLLAFDARGYRLGYGGGYYDRTIAALRPAGLQRAFGFAYAAQEVGAAPVDPNDARLDGVITEAGLMTVAEVAAEAEAAD